MMLYNTSYNKIAAEYGTKRYKDIPTNAGKRLAKPTHAHTVMLVHMFDWDCLTGRTHFH